MYVLDGAALLADGRGQTFDADRSAIEFLDDGLQKSPVQRIESVRVDLKNVHRMPGYCVGDDAVALYFSEIAHTTQQPVRDTGRAPRARCDGHGAVVLDRQVQSIPAERCVIPTRSSVE